MCDVCAVWRVTCVVCVVCGVWCVVSLCVRVPRNIVNDSYRTDVCLVYPPYLIGTGRGRGTFPFAFAVTPFSSHTFSLLMTV